MDDTAHSATVGVNMITEFDFSNLHFLTDTNVNNKMSSADLYAIDESKNVSNSINNIIEIFDETPGSNHIRYTYEKFIETLEKFGLEGFVTA